MQKVVEEYSGAGTLRQGDIVLGAAEYELTVWQELLDAGDGETIAGMKRLECQLEVIEGQTPSLGENFTLVTQEGHEVELFVKRARLFGGQIEVQPTGALMRSG